MEEPRTPRRVRVGRNRRGANVIQVNEVKYNFDDLLHLMRPPPFVPVSQTESGFPVRFPSVRERVQWMHDQRVAYGDRLERVIRNNPELEPVLTTPLFREKLYMDWLENGEQEQLNGTVRYGQASVVETLSTPPDLPLPPEGTDRERGILPMDWHRKFIDTVFVNSWIRWHTLASYRAIQYFWNRTMEMFRYASMIGAMEMEAGNPEQQREYAQRLQMISGEMRSVATVLSAISHPRSVLPEEFNREGIIELRREKAENLNRASAIRRELQDLLVGSRSAESIPSNLKQRRIRELSKELDALEKDFASRSRELDWALRNYREFRRNGLIVYPPTGVQLTRSLGMLVPGSNGGLFASTRYITALSNSAIVLTSQDPGDLQPRDVIRNLHNPVSQQQTGGPINKGWHLKMLGDRLYFRNFAKNAESLNGTRLDRDLYEATPNVEMIRVPTVEYPIIPTFTDVIEHVWSHRFRIDRPPNHAKILFDLPVRLSLPGAPRNTPYMYRPGYIGGLHRSLFLIQNTFLAHPENLQHALEATFRRKYVDWLRSRSIITLRNVYYGPKNQVPDVRLEIDQSIHGEDPIVYRLSRTLTLDIPVENRPLLRIGVMSGPAQPMPPYRFTTIKRVVIPASLPTDTSVYVME